MFVSKQGRAQAGHLFSDSAHWMRMMLGTLVLLGVGAVVVLAVNLFTSDTSLATDPNTVARADIPMIVLPKPVPRATTEPVSQQITQPVRIIDKSARTHDLNALVTDALVSLEYQPRAQDPLRRLLVQTLAERQTDAYIDVVLNAALSRGDIAPPSALIRATGELDTSRLLDAVLAQLGS